MDNFSSQAGGTPGRPVRRQDPDDQNKTAENKGVWEFGYLLPWGPAASVWANAAEARELGGVLTPPIIKRIPYKKAENSQFYRYE